MLFPNAGIPRPELLRVQQADEPRPGRGAVLPRRRSFEIPPSFSFGNRGGNNAGITPRGCCFTRTSSHNVNVSATKVMGRHTAKAGVFYEYAYKPQDSESRTIAGR